MYAQLLLLFVITVTYSTVTRSIIQYASSVVIAIVIVLVLYLNVSIIQLRGCRCTKINALYLVSG